MGVALEPCVVVVKRSVLERGGRAARLARAGHATARRVVASAAEHYRTLAAVEAALRRRRLGFSRLSVDAIDVAGRRLLAQAALVISVGGDGTLLSASHDVGDGALLGVNSSPRDSVGHFCVARRANIEEWLRGIEAGRLRPRAVARLAVSLDGRPLRQPVLNDVLIAHDHPAATSRYRLTVGRRTEEHRSSGLWISTAAGSTAGIRSAGGRVMPFGSRRMQFRVRELYREPGRLYRLSEGFVAADGRLVVESKMDAGWLFVDGARTAHRFLFGTRAEVRIADRPLRLFRGPVRRGSP